MTTLPRIGITARSNEPEFFDRSVRNYWWAVTWAGGQPIILTPDTTTLPASELIAQLDGLLLSGGGDVHPAAYHQRIKGTEKKSIHTGRDTLELTLTQAALAVDVPILGVCRGFQVLNVAMGGALVQHVEGHRSPKDKIVTHEVTILPDTLLARTLGVAGRLRTNTYHHQAVTDALLAGGLHASARTVEPPDLLEGIEAPAARWVLAVQWHPERFYELGDEHRRLFTAFIAASRGA